MAGAPRQAALEWLERNESLERGWYGGAVGFVEPVDVVVGPVAAVEVDVDLDRIEPPVTLRKGGPVEGYEGIRKGEVHVEGRPVLVDALGPFGNPSSDSSRTMIRLETTRALVTCYAPAGCRLDRMEDVLDRARDSLTRFCGGSEARRQVL